jgi:hypothetical protein
MFSIGNAQVNMTGVRVHHNAPASAAIAAVSWFAATMSGSLINCEVDNNTCPGVRVAPGAKVTITGLNSHNNVGNDVYHRIGDGRPVLTGGTRDLSGGANG